MSFVPLDVHSHYSLLTGLSKPQQIANRCATLGYTACALTDYASLSGIVAFIKACKKKSIKPILGCEFYLTGKNLSTVVVLAKNLQGWKDLIKASSFANKPENILNKKPQLSLEQLAKFYTGNWIVLSGSIGTELANCMFYNLQAAYNAKTEQNVWNAMQETYNGRAQEKAQEYRTLFGNNFYLKVQLLDAKSFPASKIITDAIRKLGNFMGIPLVATPNAHYAERDDAADQRVLLCSGLKTTITAVNKKLDDENNYHLKMFFSNNNYHIPSAEEVMAVHTDEEIANTVKIAEQCETYDIFGKPSVPHFPCLNNLSSVDYLKQLCKQGWDKKISSKVPNTLQGKYTDRLNYELEVISNYPLLVDYFLIVQDYMAWARQRMLCGKGRGSGAGCLVSNLLDITDIDPLEYNLLFERFYNAGRNTAERTSLPDVDSDFQISRREDVYKYIEDKFGKDHVCQMITFGRLQGKNALKDVLRVHETCSFEEMNRITQFIPGEAEIADELQLMKEPSIIRWALENNGEELKPWCELKADGSFVGPLAKRFEQAIRLEGTKHSQGKHPAGVIISPVPLSDNCPMVYDKNSGSLIAGMEMNDLEALGYVKFDILGVATLDKISGVQSLLRTGQIE